MKKILITAILLSSFAFSTDVELYTSSVIKLIKENRKINAQLKKNSRSITLLENTSPEMEEVEIKTKTRAEKEQIAKINSFISDNQ